MSRPAVAVVVQRYGDEIAGGSESLARAVAERLAADHEVSVFTSCARDYVSWRNELPAGESVLNGVRLRRFPVLAERDLPAFNRFAEPLYARAASGAEELEFMRRQGPEAPALVEALRAERDSFAAVLFFTYLYYPTYHGLLAAPARAILVPTAHDEPPLRFALMKQVFETPRALAFCSVPEETLVRQRFAIGDKPTAVAGIGVEVPAAPDVEEFRLKHEALRPYLLYAGRIDAGKGCDAMLEQYARYRRDQSGAAELLLIGRLAMPEPRIPGVRYLGYLSEAEKHAAMAGAKAVICPSPYESLSIVLLEAFALGTPVLASGRSAVLADHCLRSQAGLVYENPAEFAEAAELLLRRPDVRAALAENGRRYVAAEYRWDVVMGKYRALIEAVGAG